jgi:acetyl-CoA synthetase
MSETPNTIDDLLAEQRKFIPPAEFVAQSHVAGTFLYEEAAQDDEGFWARQAADLVTWDTEWDQICEWNLPYAKWFLGGRLNVSFNCLDRHVLAGHGDKVAIHWEGEPGDTRAITYAQMLDEVQRCANVLRSPWCVSGRSGQHLFADDS